MGKFKTKELDKLGFTNDKLRSLVINIIPKHFKHHSNEQIIQLLSDIKNNPEAFEQDERLGKIADCFLDKTADKAY